MCVGPLNTRFARADTPTVQICITLFYFINVSVSFCCTVTVAVCSEFVIFYGWEKALKGPTSDMNKTISRMHSFRKLMMKLLVLGVGTSMMMGATMQLSRPQKDGQVHHKYAAIVCGVVLLFTVFMVVTSRDITRAFSLGDYSYSSQASERAGLKGIQQPVINREDYIPYTMASPVKGKTAAASGAAGAGLAAGAEPARKKSWFAGGRKGSSSSK